MNVRALCVALAAALFLLSIPLPARQTAAPPYTVVTREARRPLAVRVMNGQEMFALDDLTRLFSLTTREDTLAGGLTVAAGSQTIVLSPQQPLASVAGRMISLPASPVREGRVWYVPVDFVGRALAPVSPQRIDFRKPSRLILVGDVRMPRVAARTEALGSVTRVTLDVAPPTPHAASQEGSRLLLRFDADALDAGDVRTTVTTEALQGIRVGDAPQVITFDLGPRFASYRVSDQPAPGGAGRIVIDLIAQPESPQPPGAVQPPAPTGTPEPPLLDLSAAGAMRTIVIDPGHGGEDEGARGARGTLEKNVTMTVARRLKNALETRLGVRVLLTRDGDQNTGSDQRAAMANNNKADLFVSLHANASFRPALAGAEVLYLGLEGYGAETQRASRGPAEALPVVGGGTREIEIVPWELAQARHIEQSAAFARAIDAALRERVPMSPRALQQGPLRALVGANMPAILVELGYLTNADQEQKLAGDEYQNMVVQALVEGIVRFRSAAAQPAGVTGR